ncbi:transcription factor MYB124-like isoform X2 [Punica granatum]|uniref:Transcription factor MYB124-like isoform X2 n=1 Tax=Punica granatum TaxID=22663 RepID=A0A218WTY0_PUNGR|nr:transcription factor MYB124-like isoform X2 [Punica granatum]OWM75959.1 hypothetical protein CDL15_Pgr009604 [Punica granatum]
MQRKANSGGEDSKKKERHIVTWSQEEDDILREQISIHGTDNWTIIASRFKDKTTRQCRRRWYTYLNSDFKKGGWSPEEDLLLCEAQRIYGNRWTEIAKVVSGRTDNAVKNRFTTLCKKRAKLEALAKENSSSYINLNNKRVITHDPLYTTPTNAKRIRRAHILDAPESCNFVERLQGQPGTTSDRQLRTPFAVLVQNIRNNLSISHHHISHKGDIADSALSNKGTFMKKDDPKVAALMQQAELLSSLAVQVNLESTDQSFENAWKVLQDFLNQRKEGNILSNKIPETDFQRDFKELLEDLVKSSNEGSQGSWRQPDLREESPTSSEYSTGSTILAHTVNDKNQQTLLPAEEGIPEGEEGIFSTAITAPGTESFQPCDAQVERDGIVSASSFTEFGSPLQVTPLFRSLGAGIPSPKFSESERNFLMKTLGMDYSPSPALSTNPSHPPPPCKRALLQSL